MDYLGAFHIFFDLAPIFVFEKMAKIAPLIPYYHMISSTEVSHVKYLYPYKNEKQFTKDLDFFLKRYRPIDLLDLISCIKKGRELQNGRFLLTFDDGYSQMYSIVAPLLKKKGIPAVFFLNTDFINNKALCYKNKASLIINCYNKNEEELASRIRRNRLFNNILPAEFTKFVLSINYQQKSLLDELATLFELDFDAYLKNAKPYLSDEQISGMIDMGFHIGAHSVDHPLYSDISLEEQVRQTIVSVNHLKAKYALDYSVFAFPHTDRLVSKIFFSRIEGQVDLTFATGGISQDTIASNLQRIDFEKSLKSAKSILAWYYLKKAILHRLNKDIILRE